MAEQAERNDFGYDDSVDGDYLQEIENKIQFLQEQPGHMRIINGEGRMTAIYEDDNCLSGVIKEPRAEQTMTMQ